MRRRLLSIALISTLALTACQSAEERAEEHFQSALALLEAKDEERALVELRNVFQMNGFHKEARMLYGDLLRKRGQNREAYAQYLRLIEQYPDTVEVRVILAEMAMNSGDWEEVARHGEAAIELAPQDPASQSLRVALDYRTGMIDKNESAVDDAIDRARKLLAITPDSPVLRRVLLDSLVNSGDLNAALQEVDKLIEGTPDSLEFNVVRLRLLGQMNNQPEIGKQLRRLLELNPDDEEVQRSILQWHMSQNDTAGAEAFLRELAGPETGPAGGHIDVVQFLRMTAGDQAAQAELDRLIAAAGDVPESDTYRTLRAAIDFEAGKIDEALAQFTAILDDTREDTPALRDIRATYARILDAKDDRAAASVQVERILAADPGHVATLKLRARWKTMDDQPGEAIVDLRTALDQNPRDPEILTLMAEAHLREGAPELAGERLALAVEVSKIAPAESLRYASFLTDQKNLVAAERVLTDAIRATPNNLDLLVAQGELRISTEDWARATESVASLRALGGAEAETMAKRLESAIALAQNRTSDALELLQGLVNGGEGGTGAIAATIQTQAQAGNLKEARSFLDGEIAKAPDNAELKMLSANLHYMSGEVDQAKAELQALIAAQPTAIGPVRMLYTVLANTGKPEEADKVLEEGLARIPDAAMLQWIKAGNLERKGDIDGAIAVYEDIYTRDSSNLIVANNLASLITTHRNDTASLERGFVIARRLRGSEVPAFQDTYGWIEYRRGNFEDALSHLEPAARALTEDVLAQFHLGMAYAALGRIDSAKTQLEKVLTMAGENPLPQVEIARKTLADLASAAPGTAVIPEGLAPKANDN